MEFRALPISEEDANAEFQSRDPDLSDFLAKTAILYERNDCSRTFVVRRPHGDVHPPPPIYGFFTISMRAVDLSDLPEDRQANISLPRIPVVLLGMFARDVRLPAELGVADWMMSDLRRRVVSLADQIGCCGIFLETKYKKLVSYYESHGFFEIKQRGGKFRMLSPIQNVRATAAKEALLPPAG